MRVLVRLLVAVTLGATALFAAPTVPAGADHSVCAPHTTGDDLVLWPAGGCRNFIYDNGPTLMTRADLIAQEALYTSPEARFTRNFLWYSDEKQVTISDPNTKWASCAGIPGTNNRCAPDDIEADYYGAPHTGGRGFVLRAYNSPPSVTLSVFEYGGVWIAKACGNWEDTPERPNPVPHIHGIKFRDNNRDGVRQAATEEVLAGWNIRITRVDSEVGQPAGVVANLVTATDGSYRFDLDGHGPGRYKVEEIPRAGWKNYTPVSYEVDVEFGGGDRAYRRDFGNAETIVDVAKTDIDVVDPPAHIDVNVPTDLDVAVTIENLGPAEEVPVRDVLAPAGVVPPDCTVSPDRYSFTATLRRGHPQKKTFTFTVLCSRPSNHEFTFDDELTVTDPDIVDINPLNNKASTSEVIPVHAYTDVATSAVLTCADQTDVGVPADCVASITVSNIGFGPIDVTAAAQLALPADCVSDPDVATVPFAGLADGASVTKEQVFSVTCDHRSFHEIELSVATMPDDRHVFDTDPSNDTAGDGPSIMEVFHDATMEVSDLHLVCDEQLGDTTFTCTADTTYVKTGPAPAVDVILWAALDPVEGCVVSPNARAEHQFVLVGSQPQQHTFTWTLDCEPSTTLRPVRVMADITPSPDEPHAVDDPGPIDDWWVVPYCLPTVNPHGNTEPQAPGNGNGGMNQDGFYVFGTLPSALGEEVWIRDDGSGVVFGPFDDGTRIKWVEANGSEPSISDMGSNNGNGGAGGNNGQASAVDYQIKAQGDAQAFFVDENGVEVSVTCLVPPAPQ